MTNTCRNQFFVAFKLHITLTCTINNISHSCTSLGIFFNDSVEVSFFSQYTYYHFFVSNEIDIDNNILNHCISIIVVHVVLVLL